MAGWIHPLFQQKQTAMERSTMLSWTKEIKTIEHVENGQNKSTMENKTDQEKVLLGNNKSSKPKVYDICLPSLEKIHDKLSTKQEDIVGSFPELHEAKMRSDINVSMSSDSIANFSQVHYIPSKEIKLNNLNSSQMPNDYLKILPDQVTNFTKENNFFSSTKSNIDEIIKYKPSKIDNQSATTNLNSENQTTFDSHISCKTPTTILKNSKQNLEYKLLDMLRLFPRGIPYDDISTAYKNKYGHELPFRDYGYTGLMDVCSSIPGVSLRNIDSPASHSQILMVVADGGKSCVRMIYSVLLTIFPMYLI